MPRGAGALVAGSDGCTTAGAIVLEAPVSERGAAVLVGALGGVRVTAVVVDGRDEDVGVGPEAEAFGVPEALTLGALAFGARGAGEPAAVAAGHRVP